MKWARRTFTSQIVALLVLFPVMMAMAVPTGNNVITPQTMQNGSPTNGFTNGNGTGAITIFTAGSNGSIVRGINVYSTDNSAAATITLNYVVSSTSYPLVTTQIPIQAGSITTVPPVNLLSTAIFPGLPKDSAGNPVLQVGTGGSLSCSLAAGPTSGKILTVVVLNPEDL